MRIVPVSSLPTLHANANANARAPSSTLDDDANDSDDSTSSLSVYCSLSSSSSTSSSATDSKQEASPPVRRRRGRQRWLYTYPRLCFVLVLLGCAVGTGSFSAYYLAMTTLYAVGVRHALATARSQLVATEISLRMATQCALSQLPPRVVDAKTHIDLATRPWIAKLDTYAAVVDGAQATWTPCVDSELDRLQRVVATNSTAALDQVDCLVHALETTRASYPSAAASSAVVRRVEQIAKQAQVVRLLVNLSSSSSDEERASSSSLGSLAANASHEIESSVELWVDELAAFATNELKQLSDAVRMPDLPLLAGVDALLELTTGRADADGSTPFSLVSNDQVISALRAVARLDRELSRAVDRLEKTWSSMLTVVGRIGDHEAQVREEYERIRNATQVRIRQTLATVARATTKLKSTLTNTTRSSLEAFVAALAQKLDMDPLEKLDDFWGNFLNNRSELIPVELEPRSEPVWKEPIDLRVRFDAVTNATRNKNHRPIVERETKWDLLLFRSSLYDTSATLVTILLTWDLLTRLGWFVGKAAMLLTESYSDLPPVDIRDITSITTLIDFWGVLKCRHDLGSVVFALMTEGAYVLETAVHFVLWVLLELAGTLSLVSWNEAFTSRCRPVDGRVDLTASTPSTLLSYMLLWIGDPSATELSPVVSVRKQISKIHTAFEVDATTWRHEVRAAAATQTRQVSELVLERRYLLDVRANLDSCLIEVDTTHTEDMLLESSACSMSALGHVESISSWASSAVDVFDYREILNAESIVATCLSQGRDVPLLESLQTVRRLELAHGCLLDQSLYLSIASWWMLLVILLALRLTARMVIKAAGMLFWRYLSADRLEILAFSNESGAIQSPESLPKAIRRHLRNIRWRVAARTLGVALAVASVIMIGLHVLPSEMLRPLL